MQCKVVPRLSCSASASVSSVAVVLAVGPAGLLAAMKSDGTPPLNNRKPLSPLFVKATRSNLPKRQNRRRGYYDIVSGKRVFVNCISGPSGEKALRQPAHLSHSPPHLKRYNRQRLEEFNASLPKALEKLRKAHGSRRHHLDTDRFSDSASDSTSDEEKEYYGTEDDTLSGHDDYDPRSIRHPIDTESEVESTTDDVEESPNEADRNQPIILHPPIDRDERIKRIARIIHARLLKKENQPPRGVE